MCLIIACALRLSNTFVIWKYNRKKKNIYFSHASTQGHKEAQPKRLHKNKSQEPCATPLRKTRAISSSKSSTNLLCTFAHNISHLHNYHVNTFNWRLLEFFNLSLNYGFKCHVGCEKSSSEERRLHKFHQSTPLYLFMTWKHMYIYFTFC